MARKPEQAETWERQPGEPQKEWEAFLLFRDMPNRSLAAVAETLGKSYRLMGRWSQRYDWNTRAADYDNELQRKDLKEKKENIRKMNKQQVQLGLALQKKAIQALSELAIEDMSARNILDYLVQGIEIERRSRIDSVEVETPGSKGRINIMADEEESGMMQLVHSLTDARKKRGE